MNHIPKAMVSAQSHRACRALSIVTELQAALARALNRACGGELRFESPHWLRDGGAHGGGWRKVVLGAAAFNRASLNVSQVQYDDQPERALASATALSAIVHPQSPLGPSLHLHISWTEMKSGKGYWRWMADLNPSLPDVDGAEANKVEFRSALEDVVADLAEDAFSQGDRYFFIPALQRHRGVVHFYLEEHSSGDLEADEQLAQSFGERVISAYGSILKRVLLEQTPVQTTTAAQLKQQLAYHSVYFFQVLTLDRGTSAGLMVHDQNDLGILASLPARVNPQLLASFRSAMPQPQGELLDGLLACLGSGEEVLVGDDEKIALAAALRQHYGRHPEALKLQARGTRLPPTVANHRG